MTKLFLILLYLLTHIVPISKAQINDSSVEVRLKIIEGVNGFNIKNLTFGISIINHSDKDIYLTNLRHIGYYHGIHLAKKQNDAFIETDLLGQSHNEEAAVFTYKGNTVTRIIKYKNNIEARKQDSLLKLSLNQYQQYLDSDRTNLPIFIKAKQQLNDFEAINLEHILKESNEYKIYFSPLIEKNKWPSHLNGYSLYSQDAIVSNILFISTYKLDQLQKE
jgi:hypothetical protein